MDSIPGSRRAEGNQPGRVNWRRTYGLFLHGAITHAGKAGFTPTSIDTTADVSLDKVEAGFAITKEYATKQSRGSEY